MSASKLSKLHSHVTGLQVSRKLTGIRFAMDATEEAYKALHLMGINIPPQMVRDMVTHLVTAGSAMDGLDLPPFQAGITTPGIMTPVQFLQNWLPGFVQMMTKARKADELMGISTVGAWEDEEVVQGVLEPLGYAQPYGDHSNIPLSSFNTSFERRTVVRFELGLEIGQLEEARAGRIRVSAAATKRAAVGQALEIARNRIGFVGYNGGLARTYGYLNDPSLPGYVTVAATGTGATTTWATKNFLNITADIRGAAAALQSQSGDNVNPEDVNTTLGVATSCYQYFSVVSDFGISVREWLKETYPKMRIVSAPELDAANGGANVFYLHADEVIDGASDDDNRVWIQAVPAKFQALGVMKKPKSYLEDYTNATAGALLKRPFAIVRRSGI